MIVLIQRDYYGDIVDIYGPFDTEKAAEQFRDDMGMSKYRCEVFTLTSPRSKKT